jgi:hypothetical protein
MNKWEKLKAYCERQIEQAKEICPSFDKPGRSILRDGCAYVMKHYHDVLLRMKEFEAEES